MPFPILIKKNATFYTCHRICSWYVLSRREVKVNWKGPVKPSKSVAAGDVISIRGVGRLEIGEVKVNKKGRYSIEMMRYV